MRPNTTKEKHSWKKTERDIEMSEKQQLIFDVTKMKCGGCVSTVETALNELDDTDIIEVSLEKHQVVVNTSLPAKTVADAITAAGFPATVK